MKDDHNVNNSLDAVNERQIAESVFEQYPGVVFGRALPGNKKEIMLRNQKMEGEDIYRLHLEMVTDWLPEATLKHYEGSAEEYMDILKRYGGVKYGKTISRDILIPGETGLHSLHYIIQRLFGWENSHLHRFYISDERMKKLCDNKLSHYMDLVGILFRSPWMDEEEEFWADDYENGSFRNWLRRKYTGSPFSLCYGEGYFRSRLDVKEYLDSAIKYIIENYRRTLSDEDFKKFFRKETVAHMEKIVKAAEKGSKEAFKLMTADEIRQLEGHCGDLLERLSVQDCLCFGERKIVEETEIKENGGSAKYSFDETMPQRFSDFMNYEMKEEIRFVENGPDAPINQPIVNPFTDALYYNYDFGDSWNVKIQGSCGCEDLMEAGRITQDELDDAIVQVFTTYRPVVIAQDGLSVFDDVGGITGYCEFLKGTYSEGEYDGPFDYADREENLAWAASLGWKPRRNNNKTFL